MKRVVEHFKQNDPTLAPVISAAFAHPSPIRLRPAARPSQYFYDLAESIVSQQLSVKAADTIWARLKQLCGERVTPARILKQNLSSLRACGLSNAKASYLLAMAESLQSRQVRLHKIHELSNEEVIAELIKFKGVGRWTAEMFLMFTLGRPDVFSYLDLGLIRAIENTYGLKDPTPAQLEQITAKWSPYRTYAALALWHSRDNQPL